MSVARTPQRDRDARLRMLRDSELDLLIALDDCAREVSTNLRLLRRVRREIRDLEIFDVLDRFDDADADDAVSADA